MNFFLSRGKAKVFCKTLSFSQLQAKKVLGGSRVWARVWPRMGVRLWIRLGWGVGCPIGVDIDARFTLCRHLQVHALEGPAPASQKRRMCAQKLDARVGTGVRKAFGVAACGDSRYV